MPERQSLKIIRIVDETADTYSIYLERPESEAFDFLPGQYLTVIIEIKEQEYRRTYSLSSSPKEKEHLVISIKRMPQGIVSNYLRDYLLDGDILDVLSPGGNFYVEPNVEAEQHYVMLAAGSGITPIMSMIRAVLPLEPQSRVSLWYGSRTEESIIFKEALLALKEAYPERLTLYFSLSQPHADWKGPKGRLDKNHVYQLIQELFLEDEYLKEYYICGPSEMMAEVDAAMEKHAIDPMYIHQEFFTAPVLRDINTEISSSIISNTKQSSSMRPNEEEYEIQDQKITLILDGEESELMVKADETILDAALEADLDPPHGCRAGLCTACRAKLHSGSVSMDESAGLSDDEIDEGYILTCQAHPLTDDVKLEYQ